MTHIKDYAAISTDKAYSLRRHRYMRDNFQCKLDEIFKTALAAGWPAVVVRSGDLHKIVGGYPGPNHRMTVCCDVIKKNRSQGDKIVKEPRKGQGANLYVRYLLPRRK
jgi:hypothetical protein